ncbi:Asp-tRNA(Asn)/Glu-tRNA(Gln) amidotransferase subunit GatC [Silvibacterium acidisoli]|uniref:Asp-tRNA(Asn)/Glu-tRNA(Gln) amidotransferase subunit GatC n=1 Tax=Acidobacteriaceae bacterium ZG23-2 TaxID=2883246 RepID=UPI00406D487F
MIPFTGKQMAEEQTVSVADVKQVAELANLELTPAEEVRMQMDLNSILAYVAELNELDTSSVAPMAQVSEVVGGVSDLRPDQVAPSLDRANVMVCAPETDGAFFKVPKVIER